MLAKVINENQGFPRKCEKGIEKLPQFCEKKNCMKKTQFILAVTLLAGGIAFAGGDYKKMVVTPEPCGPWYVSAFGGGSFFDTPAYTIGAVTTNRGVDNGWIVGGAVGLRTQDAWRFELELNHTESPLDAVLVQRQAFQVGEIERTSMMVNAVKEFPALQFLGLTPYLGAGIGLTNVQLDAITGIQDDEMVLGYQFMGGLVCDLTDCLQAYAEYRLASQGDLEDAVAAGSTIDLGWAQHVILGVRWFF